MTGLPPLPPAFVRRMHEQLAADADAYFASFREPYVRGLRRNPRKPVALEAIEGLLSPVPWEPMGHYLATDSRAGSLPLHEAGAYYLQEPSAMIPARVLAPQSGETVLDLCAAPGGKSTQLADQLHGQGLLVCNEPVPSRAQILSRNLERMGVTNSLVVSADPSQLEGQWPCAFDAILVDAPCSGEGMFRRHPETQLEWDEATPARCAERQKRILQSAVSMLKPGGRLAYSTCTLNPQENEDVVLWLLAEYSSLSPVPFSLPSGKSQPLSAPQGTLRVYPHELAGEGHFVALLRKEPDEEDSSATSLMPAAQVLKPPPVPPLQAYEAFCRGHALPPPNAAFGDCLLHAPALLPLTGIRVLRAGIHLGHLKGKVFAPDHALALSLPDPAVFPAVPLTEEQAQVYLSGEVLTLPNAPSGYALVTHQGLSIGFVKGSGGQLKNHYPKGLRRHYHRS